MRDWRGAFYVGQPHHMRLWEPILDKLRKAGMEVIYFTSHATFPFEISAFNYGRKPLYVEDLLTESDLEKEEEIYRRVSKALFSCHNSEPVFKALSPLDVSKIIRNAIREAILFPKFLKEYNIDIVFALHELNRWGKLLAYITFKLGIPFVTLQEGAYYSESFIFSFHSEYSTANFIWGKQTLEHLLKYGNALEKNIVVGDTHLDVALPKYKGKESFFKKKVCKDLNFDYKKPLVLLIHGSGIEKELILGKVINTFPFSKEFNFVLKLHPNVTRASTEDFRKRHSRENFKIVQLYSSYDLLAAADVCITLGVSTLTFEAFAFEKPVIELKYDNDVKGFYSRYGICDLVLPEKIEEKVGEIINYGILPDRKKKIKDWLEYVFYKLDCKATDRILEYIEFILSEKDFYTRHQKRKEFRFEYKPQKRVSVVIPVFGNINLLQSVLFELFKIFSPESDEILLLFPKDLYGLYNEFKKLRGYGFLMVLLTEKNSLSCLINEGIERSRGKYILVLKEGLIPLKFFLPDVLNKLDSKEDFIIGSYVVDQDKRIVHAGAEFNENNTVSYPLRGEIVTNVEIKEREYPMLDLAVLAKRQSFEKLGKFDERLHDFYSILDYTFEAYHKGYINLVSPLFFTGFFVNPSFSPLDHKAHLQFYTKWRGRT